jgi:hypothetical protein
MKSPANIFPIAYTVEESTLSNQADSDLGQWAKQALSNPALQEAFRRYEQKIVDLLRQTDSADMAKILTLKQHLTSLGVVQKNLGIMVQDGDIARLDFEQKQTFADRAKSAFRKIA